MTPKSFQKSSRSLSKTLLASGGGAQVPQGPQNGSKSIKKLSKNDPNIEQNDSKNFEKKDTQFIKTLASSSLPQGILLVVAAMCH